MLLTDLLSARKELTRANKVRFMPFLAVALAQEEVILLLTAGAEYPVWTPINTFSAAETVLNMLETHKASRP